MPTHYDEFLSFINAICANLKSDKKALAEILSFFLPVCNKGWNILSNTLDVNNSLLKSFTNIAMGDYTDFEKTVQPLINNLSSMSKKNKGILKTMLSGYMGNMHIVFLKIIEFLFF